MLVVVPVDGTLRIASGAVYDFYQFTQPMSERLTDEEWRVKIGQSVGEDGNYTRDERIEKPEWTKSYWDIKDWE